MTIPARYEIRRGRLLMDCETLPVSRQAIEAVLRMGGEAHRWPEGVVSEQMAALILAAERRLALDGLIDELHRDGVRAA